MKAFRIIDHGIQTTVQDGGRPGLMKYGIPISGAMDQRSFTIGNLLLRNPEGAAALETALQGLKLQALTKITIAITGADLDPWLNNKPVPQWTAFTVTEGDVLYFKKRKKGFRTYIAVRGGIDIPKILGSRSTFARGGIGTLLREGDTLSIFPPDSKVDGPPLVLLREYWPDLDRTDPIRVIMGPQDDYFTPRGVETFLSSTYRITPHFDRQGFRTEGPAIEIAKGPGIITDPIPPGAIQVPGDGKPIVLLRDSQVTGGYAKIATVARVELDFLGQRMPGDTIRFKAIDRRTALEILHEEMVRLGKVRQLLQ